MEQKENFFAESRDKVEEYLQDRLLLFKLKTVEQASKLAAAMFIGIIIAIVSVFILFFLSIMGGYYFADLTGNLFYGFGIIAGIYIIVLLVIFLSSKNWLRSLISNKVIKIIFDKTDDNE
ncbi:phage holin family protein [Danxiaibacter flavus]|uniref:Phage holin family protein n=1 Tax=Danxiaibacter flavus TaxID=3049108 RepID=A0ABV3ZMQ1_9BACT|nr:phage holin family protein [Chitinophagaceae bacterium DXS]